MEFGQIFFYLYCSCTLFVFHIVCNCQQYISIFATFCFIILPAMYFHVSNICDIVFPSFRFISLYLNWCTRPSDMFYGSRIVLKIVLCSKVVEIQFCDIFADAGEGNIGSNQSFPTQSVDGCHPNQTSQSRYLINISKYLRRYSNI